MSDGDQQSFIKRCCTFEGLTFLNWANLLAYLANLIIVQLIGAFGAFNLPNNSELSDKYQTIITPSGWAFSIWGLIYFTQGVWAIVQMLPPFRQHPLVQKGAWYWYIFACAAQIGWTFVFAYEIIWLSLVFMIAIWVSLLALTISAYYAHSTEDRWYHFWLLIFPFTLHLGWITCASALNVNLVVVSNDAEAYVQLATGIVSLAALHAIAVWCLYVPKRANYTVPCVIAWANGAIAAELTSPKDKITALFDSTTINGVRVAAAAVSIICLSWVVSRIIYGVIRHFFLKSRDDTDEEFDAEKGVAVSEEAREYS